MTNDLQNGATQQDDAHKPMPVFVRETVSPAAHQVKRRTSGNVNLSKKNVIDVFGAWSGMKENLVILCIVSTMTSTSLPGEGWLSRIRVSIFLTCPKQRIFFSCRLTDFLERTAGEDQHPRSSED